MVGVGTGQTSKHVEYSCDLSESAFLKLRQHYGALVHDNVHCVIANKALHMTVLPVTFSNASSLHAVDLSQAYKLAHRPRYVGY